jgi:hypothetical protein
MKATLHCSDLNERGGGGGGSVGEESGTTTHVAMARSEGRCMKSDKQGT